MSSKNTSQSSASSNDSSIQNRVDNEEMCLKEMNSYLKKLKIEGQWNNYSEIRVVGQAERTIFYTIIAVLFPCVYILNQAYRVIPQQNVVVQILCVLFALWLQSSLPRYSFTIQLSKTQSTLITKDDPDKERFMIVQEMHQRMRESERNIRLKHIDFIRVNKKKKEN